MRGAKDPQSTGYITPPYIPADSFLGLLVIKEPQSSLRHVTIPDQMVFTSCDIFTGMLMAYGTCVWNELCGIKHPTEDEKAYPSKDVNLHPLLSPVGITFDDVVAFYHVIDYLQLTKRPYQRLLKRLFELHWIYHDCRNFGFEDRKCAIPGLGLALTNGEEGFKDKYSRGKRLSTYDPHVGRGHSGLDIYVSDRDMKESYCIKMPRNMNIHNLNSPFMFTTKEYKMVFVQQAFIVGHDTSHYYDIKNVCMVVYWRRVIAFIVFKEQQSPRFFEERSGEIYEWCAEPGKNDSRERVSFADWVCYDIPVRDLTAIKIYSSNFSFTEPNPLFEVEQTTGDKRAKGGDEHDALFEIEQTTGEIPPSCDQRDRAGSILIKWAVIRGASPTSLMPHKRKLDDYSIIEVPGESFNMFVCATILTTNEDLLPFKRVCAEEYQEMLRS